MDRPIGMFDSGFGGLTVARALIDLLPSEDLVYIGDTGRYPYGSKPLSDVRGYARELAWSLVKDYNAKAVVVACNTATAAGLDDLRMELPVPVLDVVEPGARALVRTTMTGRVGVIGTVGTVSSGAYVRAITDTGVPVSLTSAACPGFVEFVERGQTTGDEVGHAVTLVSSADETAFAVRDRLVELGLEQTTSRIGRHRFVSSGDVDTFRELGSRLLGPELDHTERW